MISLMYTVLCSEAFDNRNTSARLRDVGLASLMAIQKANTIPQEQIAMELRLLKHFERKETAIGRNPQP
jgi:hypothetical protein